MREAINKPTGEITATDLAGLTELEAEGAWGSEIMDLTGLEYAVNLTRLWLWRNQISDISALSGLTNLTRLWLNSNQVSDLSTLSGLTNLTRLELHDNPLSTQAKQDIATLRARGVDASY